METDEVKQLWQHDIPDQAADNSGIETAFRFSLEVVSARLQKKRSLDISLAVSAGVVMALVPWILGMKYQWEPALLIFSFTIIMLGIHLVQGRRMRHISRQNKPVTENLSESAQLIVWRIRAYRYLMPLFAGVLFTWYSLRFDMISIIHLVWILPVVILGNEIILIVMYKNTLKEIRSLIFQIQSAP